MDWEQNYEALKEYQKQYGTWAVDPTLVDPNKNKAARQHLENLAAFVTHNQRHVHQLSQERRHLWHLLTGQETIPVPRTKPPRPRQRTASSSPKQPARRRSSNGNAHMRHIVNGQEFSHRTSSQDLYSRYRRKGVGLSQMQWNSMFDKLIAYRRVHGHPNVPVRFKADPKLGKWVSRQREARATMCPERRDKLLAIGFAWTQKRPSLTLPNPAGGNNKNGHKTYDRLWNSRFAQLEAFFAKYKHTLVETADISKVIGDPEECDKFRRWCSKQRALGGRGELRPDRSQLLDQVGFWADRRMDAAAACRAFSGDLTAEMDEEEEDDATEYVENELTQPISVEAVEAHIQFFRAAAEKEKKTQQKIIKDRGPPIATGNRLPPLDVPAHVKRQQTLDYFKQVRQRKKEDEEAQRRNSSFLLVDEAARAAAEKFLSQQLHPMGEDESEEEESETDEEKYGDCEEEEEEGYDDAEAKAIAQTVAEQVLMEAIEASEYQQQQPQQQLSGGPHQSQLGTTFPQTEATPQPLQATSRSSFTSGFLAPMSVPSSTAVPPGPSWEQQQQTHTPKPAAPPNKKPKTTTTPAFSRLLPIPVKFTVTPSPQAAPRPVARPSAPRASPASKDNNNKTNKQAPSAARTSNQQQQPQPQQASPQQRRHSSYQSPIPSKKIEYHMVGKEIQSFEDAFIKMLDAKTPDWKRKRRWSYVCS